MGIEFEKEVEKKGEGNDNNEKVRAVNCAERV